MLASIHGTSLTYSETRPSRPVNNPQIRFGKVLAERVADLFLLGEYRRTATAGASAAEPGDSGLSNDIVRKAVSKVGKDGTPEVAQKSYASLPNEKQGYFLLELHELGLSKNKPLLTWVRRTMADAYVPMPISRLTNIMLDKGATGLTESSADHYNAQFKNKPEDLPTGVFFALLLDRQLDLRSTNTAYISDAPHGATKEDIIAQFRSGNPPSEASLAYGQLTAAFNILHRAHNWHGGRSMSPYLLEKSLELLDTVDLSIMTPEQREKLESRVKRIQTGNYGYKPSFSPENEARYLSFLLKIHPHVTAAADMLNAWYDGERYGREYGFTEKDDKTINRRLADIFNQRFPDNADLLRLPPSDSGRQT